MIVLLKVVASVIQLNLKSLKPINDLFIKMSKQQTKLGIPV